MPLVHTIKQRKSISAILRIKILWIVSKVDATTSSISNGSLPKNLTENNRPVAKSLKKLKRVQCLQYGGHGYIREWGMEQFVRDARINMIYEGTNTIQSLDLLGRKVLGDNGARLKKFGALVSAFIEEEGTNEAMQEFVNPLADLGDKLTKLTTELGMKAFGNADEVGGAAVDYLRVVGHLVFAYFWARMAKLALEKQGSGDPFYKAKLATARFYFAKLLPETATLIRTARSGVRPLMEMDEALF